jgi:DNA-binding MarR family transcriptional regulator
MPTPDAPTATPPDVDRDGLVLELSSQLLPLVHALRHQAARVFAPLGLSPSRVLVLELIERGVDRPKALAEVLETVQSAVSAILADLEGLALIARTVDPEDGRKVQLQLTDAGRETQHQLGAAWLEASRQHLGDVDLDDLRAVARVAAALTRRSPT